MVVSDFDEFMLWAIALGLVVGLVSGIASYSLLSNYSSLPENKKNLSVFICIIFTIFVSETIWKTTALDYMRPGIDQIADDFLKYPDDWVKNPKSEHLINPKDSLILKYNSRNKKFVKIQKIGEQSVALRFSEGRIFYKNWEEICENRRNNAYKKFIGIKEEKLIK